MNLDFSDVFGGVKPGMMVDSEGRMWKVESDGSGGGGERVGEPVAHPTLSQGARECIANPPVEKNQSTDGEKEDAGRGRPAGHAGRVCSPEEGSAGSPQSRDGASPHLRSDSEQQRRAEDRRSSGTGSDALPLGSGVSGEEIAGRGRPAGHAGRVCSPEDEKKSLIRFRAYQLEAFRNRTNGIEVWLWGRQTGKSFTLAAWMVDRLITIPGRTVTVLSNSKFNGIELNVKCAEVCRLMGHAFEQADLSADERFESMRAETRITINGKVGRILILAANPRTARSFSGDLVLDEFAFQEDGAAIWNEASPILAAHPDYLCRIASTPNGKHNQFYSMATDPFYPLRKVTRTMAFEQGCPVYHPITREAITPARARELAQNKRAYDQNFECVFEDESMALLTHELINAAERPDVGIICDQEWSDESLQSLTEGRKGNEESGRKTAKRWVAEASDPDEMFRHLLMTVCNGSADRIDELMNSDVEIRIGQVYDEARARRERDSGRLLYAGVDVGRQNDRTVITVLERIGNVYLVRAMLRLAGMRLPEQQQRLETILKLRDLRAMKIDMTGLGLGLCEYTQQKYGARVQGVNFSSNAPITPRLVKEGRNSEMVRVTEALATQLLQAFEDRAMQIPIDPELRDDLRKPERFVSPNGRVSIAATRDGAGHADHFWSLALALSAAQTPAPVKLEWVAWTPKAYERRARW